MGRPTDSTWFRQVLGQYPTGVCAVTATQADGSRTGFVVGSFTSVSLDPPLVAFFPAKSSTSWPKIERVGRFCINVLSESQAHLCRRFAAKAEDKFAGMETRPAGSGSPILDGVVAWIDCDLYSVQEAGDHYVVIARVRELDVESPSLPLLFVQGAYGRFVPFSLVASDRRGALTGA
ncbi:flavin reductase family protein [Mycobacterium malmoense]|uniref:Monooxygenase n=2 Tax=Mycobacterium malmoense TaxID=1780 RepID=A0ABX3SSD6_MYCMA|nr:monooxygenase [Mycobacterium malmoense]QZA20169.1 flavin reductase family protein [Mycobacterium malmoense]UNB96922.1 flavin reductase family protein [Mycobacterium malmoense]